VAEPTGLEPATSDVTDYDSRSMESTTYLCRQQFSRDMKRQVMTQNDPFTHPPVTQLVAHYKSEF